MGNITVYRKKDNSVVSFLTDTQLLRFFDNRSPFDWELVKEEDNG